MPALHFQRAAALIGLLALPPLGVLWWRACRRVDAIGRSLLPDKAAGAARRGNLLRGALRIGALGALILALAGPAVVGGAALGRARAAGVPLVFVLDVSASMTATDVEPDRLARGREAIEAVCAALPAARTALVVAAADAAVVCPLTADRAAFLSLVERAGAQWMGGRGTRLAAALGAAADLVERERLAGAVVVLVSDGEDHGPSPEPVIEELRGRGVVLHTVTVGSEAGAELTDLPPGPASAGGGPVVTRARPEKMASWAEMGGGRAWRILPDSALPRPRPADMVPHGVTAAAARAGGGALELSIWLYLVAALLLAADLALAA